MNVLTIQEKILTLVATALKKPGAPPGLHVHRSAARAIHQDQLPAAIPYPLRESVQLATMDEDLDRTLKLRVELREEGDPSDQKLSPLIAWVERALLTDTALASLIVSITPVEIQWTSVGKKGKVYGAAAFDFEINYLTVTGVPEEQP